MIFLLYQVLYKTTVVPVPGSKMKGPVLAVALVLRYCTAYEYDLSNEYLLVDA